MADPVSILGTAGALANVIQLAGQTIIAIRDLQSDWKDADLTFLSLTGQLSALRAALAKIEEWMGNAAGDTHHQLVMDLDVSMDCCRILLTELQALVSSLQQGQNQSLDFRSRVKLVFSNKTVDDIQKLLEQQTNAMTLLLTACNCQTTAEQKALLVQSSTRKAFRKMNLDTASLVVHRDADSIATQTTDGLSKLSLAFSFDREILTSNVYERVFRSFTKKILRHPQRYGAPVKEQPRAISPSNKCQRHEKKILLFYAEDSRADGLLHRIVGLEGNKFINVRSKLERTAVYKFVIWKAKTMVLAMRQAGIKLRLESNEAHCNFLLDYADDLSPTEPLEARVGEAIRSLWHDPCMKGIRQSPQKFDLTDPVLHLFDDIDRIASPNYTPTSREVLNAQCQMPAVIELHAIYEKNDSGFSEIRLVQMRLLDVSLRFTLPNIVYSVDNISSVVLHISLHHHYTVLQDKPLQIPLLKYISILHSEMWSPWFAQEKNIVLLLSDWETFESRLAFYPFSDYFPGYTAENEPHAILTFLQRQFRALAQATFSKGELRLVSKEVLVIVGDEA